MKRRILSMMLIAAVSLTSFTACGTKKETENASGNNSSTQTTTETKKSGKLFDNPVTFTMMMQNHPSWPYQKDWYIQKAITEKTNVNLEVTAVTDTNFAEKVNTTLASGDLPDIMVTIGLDYTHKYALQGAYANILEKIDKLPNFKKWRDSNKEYVADYLSSDGNLYIFPEQGIAETNRRGWLYREDIFKKHNLTVPKDDKELYDVLKKLKELYPKSYPFTFRTNLGQFLMIAPSWGTDYQMYLNRSNNQWTYGPIENNFKSMIEYYSKLYKDGLIPPDFLTLNTKVWQDAMSTDSAFVTIDYVGRIDFFNGALRKDNPQFNLAYMAPPKGGQNGVNKFAASAFNVAGFNVAANSKKLNDVLKYVDWLYSDEAKELVSWGEEGKTYKVENGKRKFIDATDAASVRKNYGITTNGFYLRMDYASHMSTFTDELNKGIEESRKYDLPANPTLAFNDQEREVLQTTGDSVNKYMQQEISKFLLGTRPLSDWDKYVKEVQDLGLSKLVDIYKKAYERQQKSSK